MITARRTFNYQGQVLIEKMTMKSPFHYEAIFQDKGCFIYFKETGLAVVVGEDVFKDLLYSFTDGDPVKEFCQKDADHFLEDAKDYPTFSSSHWLLAYLDNCFE